MSNVTAFKINGSAMSCAPFRWQWTFPTQSTRQDGRPLYSSRYQIIAEFGQHAPAETAQWLHAVSSASFNLTCPDRFSITFVTLSAINATITNWPTLEDVHMEPFQLMFTGVL